VDIYSDHLLARDFSQFSAVPLEEFSMRVYEVYTRAKALLPVSGERFLSYVLSNNIYQSYATTEGIERVLYHLSHRIRHDVRLDKSLQSFLANEDRLRANFEMLFSDLRLRFMASPGNG
jgi:acyl carrier protein phosphodiesterase